MNRIVEKDEYFKMDTATTENEGVEVKEGGQEGEGAGKEPSPSAQKPKKQKT